MSVRARYGKKAVEIVQGNRLPTQKQLNELEIRFTNCIITYKLKHIETQPNRSRYRKVGKLLGFSFRPLRMQIHNDDNKLFTNCIFNPSDKSILNEHIKNFETPSIRFIDCKFLRRDSRFSENMVRAWRKYKGIFVKFTGKKGFVDVENDVIRLKDLPGVLEFIIIHGKNAVE